MFFDDRNKNDKKGLTMDKKPKRLECKPCDETDGKTSDICMVCGYPHSKKTLKIVKRRGRQSIKYNIGDK